MAIETINLGTPNAGDGDTVREAFRKINGNFVEFATELGGINTALNNIVTSTVDLGSVIQSIIPSEDNLYTLGTLDRQWRDIFVGPGSLYIDGLKFSRDTETGSLSISDSGNPVNLVVEGTVTTISPVTGLPTDLQALPEGGLAGQALAKASDASYDVEWVPVTDFVVPATTGSIGGIIVGDNLTIETDGKLSVPVATSSTLGVVKAGTNVTIDVSGAISVSKGAGINTVKDIPDVNSTAGGAALDDGALLIYNASSERWDTIRNLRSDEMDGGFF